MCWFQCFFLDFSFLAGNVLAVLMRITKYIFVVWSNMFNNLHVNSIWRLKCLHIFFFFIIVLLLVFKSFLFICFFCSFTVLTYSLGCLCLDLFYIQTSLFAVIFEFVLYWFFCFLTLYWFVFTLYWFFLKNVLPCTDFVLTSYRLLCTASTVYLCIWNKLNKIALPWIGTG